jgi:hypothetical protein
MSLSNTSCESFCVDTLLELFLVSEATAILPPDGLSEAIGVLFSDGLSDIDDVFAVGDLTLFEQPAAIAVTRTETARSAAILLNRIII